MIKNKTYNFGPSLHVRKAEIPVQGDTAHPNPEHNRQKHANDRRKTTVKGSLSAQKPGS